MSPFACHTESSLLLMIDVQERFEAAIPSIGADGPVGRSLARLLQGTGLLGLPRVITRQYPKGLGDTVAHLREHLHSDSHRDVVLDKTHFSVLDDLPLREHLAATEAETIIIAGIEAHVCILASVADCCQRGYQVLVAGDAIASRNPQHCQWASQAMQQMGALVLPVESILFRLQRQAGGDTFKALSSLVK
ncbi:MAG: isochorismatase family protein [Planctomycetota bacterium]|nr:MAG: isochorismatase family protein [Planctomycetota bacterium]